MPLDPPLDSLAMNTEQLCHVFDTQEGHRAAASLLRLGESLLRVVRREGDVPNFIQSTCRLADHLGQPNDSTREIRSTALPVTALIPVHLATPPLTPE